MVNPAGQPDQRGAQRYSLMLRAAKVMTPEGEWVCNVREVSATGLRLRFFHDLPERHQRLHQPFDPRVVGVARHAEHLDAGSHGGDALRGRPCPQRHGR